MNIRTVQIAIAFLWSGMLLGISFVEAPLKFQAPNITLGLGLGIGRLVFFALNKFEIAFALILLVTFFMAKNLSRFGTIAFAIVLLILTVQTAWLLPSLDIRAEQVITGVAAPFSMTHYYYIGTEVIKLLLVFALGWDLTKRVAK